MSARRPLPILVVLAVLAAWPVLGNSADLVVIHDGPGTVPAGTYYGHLVSGVDQAGVLPGTQFPMTTRLKPGPLASDAAGQGLFDANWLAHPIFVLGTDPMSFRWLQQHRQTLTDMGAAGLVIEAQTEAVFKDLQALAGGLSISPVRGPWLEQKLLSVRIASYPLVVMPDGRISGSPELRGAP